MSKNVMSGGYTPQEARNLLLIRGIEHVKDIIPHNAPKIANLEECDDLPLFWLDYINLNYANTYDFNKSTYINHGRMSTLYLRLDMKLCWHCSNMLREYLISLSPMLSFHGNVVQHYCEICGEWEPDEIPF